MCRGIAAVSDDRGNAGRETGMSAGGKHRCGPHGYTVQDDFLHAENIGQIVGPQNDIFLIIVSHGTVYTGALAVRAAVRGEDVIP